MMDAAFSLTFNMFYRDGKQQTLEKLRAGAIGRSPPILSR
jgi:hypothetical protein